MFVAILQAIGVVDGHTIEDGIQQSEDNMCQAEAQRSGTELARHGRPADV